MSAQEAEKLQPFNASQIAGKDMALLKQRVGVSEAGAAAAKEEAREARSALQHGCAPDVLFETSLTIEHTRLELRFG